MSKKDPKCHICSVELAEGYSLNRVNTNPLYLCVECYNLISAVAHDSAFNVFDDVAKVMSGPARPVVSYEYRLEGFNLEDARARS